MVLAKLTRVVVACGGKCCDPFPQYVNGLNAQKMNWQVYIILCSDDSLYTGITTDVERRFDQHRNGRGAKYFRGRVPRRIVYLEGGHNRSSASRRELQIKGMNRDGKKCLLSSRANEIEGVQGGT